MIVLFVLINWLILVLCITVHEAAHAWAGDRLGDPTAKIAGRMTLNPLAHLDMIGTVLLPLMTMLSGSPLFIGWAKPTPFDPFNLRNPRKDAGLIALSGPASNLLLALAFSLILRLPVFDYSSILYIFITMIIRVNVVLAVFNLIPIHPLDGFNVVGGLLPHKYYKDWAGLERYGIVFLFLLIFPLFGGSSPISNIISPVSNFILSFFLPAKIGGII